ncbi:copper chaperone PCu(A)C [Sphingobium sp. CR28]|uniref:copper chaperone PCu(A)C n=1 Tax=Sphingobium sp. CR28 TaxID=3400272 RepID=UPI003FEE3A6D
MRLALAFRTLAFAGLALAGCEDKPLYVDKAWVRLNANPEAPAAGYFTIHGGSSPVTLRDVTTEGAVRAEMHDSQMKDGMMSMTPIQTVDVAAGQTVTFAPGGKHLMLWSINPGIVAQGKITLTFIFSNGDRILVDAPITKPTGGAGAASGAVGNHMADHTAH